MKTIKIDLTEDQGKRLDPFFDEAQKKPEGSVLIQPWRMETLPGHPEHPKKKYVGICALVPYEKAQEIIKIVDSIDQ